MKISRRQFLIAGASTLIASGCKEARQVGKLLSSAPPKLDLTGTVAAPVSGSIDAVSHALNRLTFGARPGDYARVQQLGVSAFIEEQLAPEKISDDFCDSIIRRFESLSEPDQTFNRLLQNTPAKKLTHYEVSMTGEMFEESDKELLEDLSRATLLRATFSRRQLYEVMCGFWSDHFNIHHSKGDCKWLKAADDLFVIRRHALGNFRDLLHASATSPAMLWYLDGRENKKSKPGDAPNENYAREVLELHTLGVHGGYTQRDVMEVARALSGWTVRGKGAFFSRGKVAFDSKRHDDGEKLILDQKIPAGLGAGDLDRVLDILVGHPSTARYLATKLCTLFISDTPPAPAIEATARAFSETRGDIRATLRALFYTPEFAASAGGKFKRPFHFIVSALRATNAQTDAPRQLLPLLTRMGHAPFSYPTPDGYPFEAHHWTGSLLWRWNFAADLVGGKLSRTSLRPDELTAHLGDRESIVASIFGRRPSDVERAAIFETDTWLATALAAPAFQRC